MSKQMPRRRLAPVVLLAALTAMLLGGCATTGTGPKVHRLTQQHYPPTQTVDVLSSLPTHKSFVRVARLQAGDPTGNATRSQLIAELTDSAQSLGANAIVVQQQKTSDSSGSELSFSPSGGQMQSSSGTQSLVLKALAIRYTQ